MMIPSVQLSRLSLGGFTKLAHCASHSPASFGSIAIKRLRQQHAILAHRSFTCTPRMREIFSVQDADDFQERVVRSDKPVVIDFHATWCGPCKMLAPRLETAIAGTKDAVHLAKVDIDENDELAADYDIKVVPTVLGMKGGKVVDRFQGLVDEDVIQTFVQRLTEPNKSSS